MSKPQENVSIMDTYGQTMKERTIQGFEVGVNVLNGVTEMTGSQVAGFIAGTAVGAVTGAAGFVEGSVEGLVRGVAGIPPLAVAGNRAAAHSAAHAEPVVEAPKVSARTPNMP